MSVISAELQSKIASWRIKAAEGTLTLDEMREGIKYLRSDRMSAATSAAKTRLTKAKSAAPVAEDMLADLEGL